MKILLINGNPDSGNHTFESYIEELKKRLIQNNQIVNQIILREKEIQYCIGCWNCWVKTPGLCFAQDDSHEICREVIHSDLLLFVSPVIMGYTSALLKKMQDKLIPLVHPYIEMVQNESHHIKRYDTYPKLGLLLEPSKDTDETDFEIIENMYKRLALNFKSELAVSTTITQSVEEVAHAINNI